MGFVLNTLFGSETVLTMTCNAQRGPVPFTTSATIKVAKCNLRILLLPLGCNKEDYLATASRDMAVMCHWLVKDAKVTLCEQREKIAN